MIDWSSGEGVMYFTGEGYVFDRYWSVLTNDSTGWVGWGKGWGCFLRNTEIRRVTHTPTPTPDKIMGKPNLNPNPEMCRFPTVISGF